MKKRKSIAQQRDELLFDYVSPLKPRWCVTEEFDVASPHEKRQLSAIAHAEVINIMNGIVEQVLT